MPKIVYTLSDNENNCAEIAKKGPKKRMPKNNLCATYQNPKEWNGVVQRVVLVLCGVTDVEISVNNKRLRSQTSTLAVAGTNCLFQE